MERAPRNPALDALLSAQPAIRRGAFGDGAPGDGGRAGVPSGYAGLDAALPGGGWARGSVTELLADAPGIGELSLLLPMLRASTAEGRWVAFVNPPHVPYAPALANAGIALERLLLVECPDDADALWATELLLREGVVAALALWVARTTPARQRRLQCAAAATDTLAVVYRPLEAREEPSPVGTRMRVAARDGRLELELVKVRGGRPRTVLFDPATFDAAQGAEWPLAPSAGACLRVEPAPIVALAPHAPSDAPGCRASSDRRRTLAPD